MSENTNASQGLEYNIDIVFCIDLSSGSSAELESLKDFVLRFPTDLIRRHESQGKNLRNIRVRFILFPDVSANHSHEFSYFLSLSSDKRSKQFQRFVQNLRSNKRQADAKEALHSLSNALHSDWTHHGERQRHIIVLATRVGLHEEFADVRSSDQKRFHEIDTLLKEITDYWEGTTSNSRPRGAKLGQAARRLILFAPDVYPWQMLADTWAQALWLPTRNLSEFTPIELETVVEVLSNGV
jgi:hypothetical protein